MLNLVNSEWLALDRHDLKRDDPQWIADRLNEPDCQFIAMWRYRFPIENGYVKRLTRDELTALSQEPLTFHYLGEELRSGLSIFAIELFSPETNVEDWRSLRHLEDDEPHTEILLYAQGLLNFWRHQLGGPVRGQGVEGSPLSL